MVVRRVLEVRGVGPGRWGGACSRMKPSRVVERQNTLKTDNHRGRPTVTRKKADLLQGTLDLLVLKTLDLEPLHGWAISKRIRQMSSGVLDVGQGSLYPALYRLRDRGLIRSRWEITEDDQRVKVYELTRAGEEALGLERESFRRFVGAVEQILETT